MGPFRNLFNRWPLAAVLLAGIAACTPTIDQRGNLVDADRLAEIRPGASTKDAVSRILGTPSAVSTFDEKTWYYISRRTEQTAFFKPEITDQNVVIVDFDERGIVTAVRQQGMEARRDVEVVERATPTPGRELTFLEQLLGNVGRFNDANTAADRRTSRGGPGGFP